MTNVFTWEFPSFDLAPVSDGLLNVVKTVHWIYRVTNGDHQNFLYGVCNLEAPQEGNFTHYEDITKLLVESWIAPYVDVEAMQVTLTDAIEKLINPPVITVHPNF
jgi:hypothetical protein